MQLFIILLFCLFSKLCFALNVLVVTEGKSEWPQICIEQIKKHEAFLDQNLNFYYLEEANSVRRCQSQGSAAILKCEQGIAAQYFAKYDIDKIFYYAKASQSRSMAIPRENIIFVQLQENSLYGTPCSTTLHEFMHLLGFLDEYQHRHNPHKCSQAVTAMNLISIPFYWREYKSESAARTALAEYHEAIYWWNDIQADTPITHRVFKTNGQIRYKIGTPLKYADRIGFFPANCRGRFRPSTAMNVMGPKQPYLIPPYYEAQIKKVLSGNLKSLSQTAKQNFQKLHHESNRREKVLLETNREQILADIFMELSIDSKKD